MRLYLTLTKNNELVAFDYQHFLIGTLHKWLGMNSLHDDISLYSISWLKGGIIKNDQLDFSNGAKWFLSFYETAVAKEILQCILTSPDTFCGMKVTDVQIVTTPSFLDKERFFLASPVLVRMFDGNSIKHLTYDDQVSDSLLTKTLETKLSKAGLNKFKATVSFDRTYAKARTKLVTIKGIQNRANYCPVIIEGDPEAISFAWDVGVGHSTGSGFGALN